MSGSFPKCPVGEKEVPDKMSGMDFGLGNALVITITAIGSLYSHLVARLRTQLQLMSNDGLA